MFLEDNQNREGWREVGLRRLRISRLFSLALIIATSIVTYLFLVMYHIPTVIVIFLTACYFILGYLGMTYFVNIWFGYFASTIPVEEDPLNPLNRATKIADDTKIAILLPVYNEDIRRVAAGLAAMSEELIPFPEHRHFDFFILSDTRDPDLVAQEEISCFLLRSQFPQLSFFYRQRSDNLEAKLGNITDFLKRWGNSYKYMVMLDADSIVPGDSIVTMARVMEGNPQIGIVQANLLMAMHKTLHARLSKFISAFSLSVGFFGQYFFYLGRSFYYGHNAIVRIKPFMEHCALPLLKRKGPWRSGRPLSHDYIEAALMDGAGYEVWSLPQIPSYEELPTNLIDDTKREFRWMYGSLTYLRVCLAQQISWLYRFRLFTSAINYLNAIFGWILYAFSILGALTIFCHPHRAHWIMHRYMVVFAFSITFLVFSIVAKFVLPAKYFQRRGDINLFGGLGKLIWSYIIYTVYSIVMTPVSMALSSRALLMWMKSRKLSWSYQEREDRKISWGESFRVFGWISVLGITLFIIIYFYVFDKDTVKVQKVLQLSKTQLFFWYVPLLVGMIFSPIIVRLTSQSYPWMEKKKWLISPTETAPHPVITKTEDWEISFRKAIPENWTMLDSLQNQEYARLHASLIPSRPLKASFWMDRLGHKSFESLSRLEKFVVYRCRELWEYFLKKEVQR